VINIPVALLEKIKREAENAYPNECCGLLVGNKTGEIISITRTVASPNTKIDDDGNGHDSFEIDPKIHFDLLREVKQADEIIIGNYHSHPGKPPTPSERDIENAFETDHVWLIVGVNNDGKAGECRAFDIDGTSGKVSDIKIN